MSGGYWAASRTRRVVGRVLLGFMAAFLGAAYAGMFELAPWHAPVILAALGVSTIVHTYLHELGHLAAAWLVRLPVTGVAVLSRATTPRRTVRGISVVLGLSGIDSYVAVGRPVSPKGLRLRHATFTLAGSLANIAFTAAVILLASITVDGDASLYPHALLGTFVLAGLVMGLVSLLPQTYRTGRASDGLILWRLAWRRQPPSPIGPETRRVLAELKQRAATDGNRWRTFEELNTAMRLRAEEAERRGARPSLLNSPADPQQTL